jgi:TPR repeat protein
MLVKSGSPKDALNLFQDAAKAGETTAMISLADLYSKRKQTIANVAELKRQLRTAAKKGDRVALYLLGTQYLQEEPVSAHNRELGLMFLHQAAMRGNKRAQNALAAAYADGAGSSETAAQLARFWARKASLPSLAKAGPPVPPGGLKSGMAS